MKSNRLQTTPTSASMYRPAGASAYAQVSVSAVNETQFVALAEKAIAFLQGSITTIKGLDEEPADAPGSSRATSK